MVCRHYRRISAHSQGVASGPHFASEALAEGQLAGQLDKAQEIAALAATVAVEEIFAGVDIERRAGFRVQGTESDELGAVASRPGNPVLLPQIIEQRQALLEFFEVLAHG